jgi:hypothetical protein
MLVRRLLLLAAVLMLLAALAAGLAPRDPAGETAAAPVTSLPKGTDVDAEISATAGSRERRVVVHRGDVLRLEVSGDELDSVLIEQLDRMEAIEPSTPARFELLVDAPAGVYPIRLVEADRRIGAIEIRN